MNAGSVIGTLLGGIGLFLLGMSLMTDGLKLAAGTALARILTYSTKTRLRGVTSGTLLTALVQSSSAVTVAAIGFVNAGLLTLGQSLWVLFGSNVVSTMTGWLVALVGLKFKIDALALPLIGIGMALRLSGERTRRGRAGAGRATPRGAAHGCAGDSPAARCGWQPNAGQAGARAASHRRPEPRYCRFRHAPEPHRDVARECAASGNDSARRALLEDRVRVGGGAGGCVGREHQPDARRVEPIRRTSAGLA